MTVPSVISEVSRALGHRDGADIIDGVKSAVAQELELLDPAIEIESTDYFNHSYIPDFMVRWKEGGVSSERGVYLRYDLRAAALGGDFNALGSLGPIVLTLPDNQDHLAIEAARRDAEAQPRLLVTGVSALDQAAIATRRNNRSPLIKLVKDNLVRGARGYIDEPAVNDLTARAAQASVSGSQYEPFLDAVDSLFLTDAATRLHRATSLIRASQSDDPSSLLLNEEGDLTVSGELSDAELRILLPHFLSAQARRAPAEFWKLIGSMVSLERVESLANELVDIDLTPLVRANLDNWSAVRSMAVMESDQIDPAGPHTVAADDHLNAVSNSNINGWKIHSKMLSISLDGWRLYVAADGRKIRGRTGSLQARWDDLLPNLDDYALTQILLQGASRTVNVGAERDDDVRSDIETIMESIEDSFFIPRVDVREAQSQDPRVIEADFTRMIASATERDASVGALARVAAKILAHRYPIQEGSVDEYLRSH